MLSLLERVNVCGLQTLDLQSPGTREASGSYPRKDGEGRSPPRSTRTRTPTCTGRGDAQRETEQKREDREFSCGQYPRPGSAPWVYSSRAVGGDVRNVDVYSGASVQDHLYPRPPVRSGVRFFSVPVKGPRPTLSIHLYDRVSGECRWSTTSRHPQPDPSVLCQDPCRPSRPPPTHGPPSDSSRTTGGSVPPRRHPSLRPQLSVRLGGKVPGLGGRDVGTQGPFSMVLQTQINKEKGEGVNGSPVSFRLSSDPPRRAGDKVRAVLRTRPPTAGQFGVDGVGAGEDLRPRWVEKSPTTFSSPGSPCPRRVFRLGSVPPTPTTVLFGRDEGERYKNG